MLTSQVPATPRPRPPAKARRSSLKASPPPPYAVASRASSISSRLDSLGREGVQRLTPTTSPVAEEWMNEHSREDLSELLLKADGLIKERETDISATSAAFKSLQEDSVVLQNKHAAFLRRIPSPTTSPVNSTVVSPATPIKSLPNSPHYYSDNLSHLAPDTNTSLRPRRARKVSVSQNDIDLLSDQNAELLVKLDRLESESVQTEQAGRRRLRNLEKEIQGLKQELEKTQTKSEELEEQAKRGLGAGAERIVEEVWRKKLEREEKIRAIRGHSVSRDDGILDFAPGNAATSSRSTPARPIRRVVSSPYIGTPAFRFPSRPTEPIGPAQDDDDIFSSSHLASLPQPSVATPGRELAVVSRLLFKIQELEEANTQITEQQVKTASTLHEVQKDAESIRRVYECLGEAESIEWEIVAEEDPERYRGLDENETIRFQSLRRSLDDASGTKTVLGGEDDFNGIGLNMQSTLNNAALTRIIMNHKSRKSVVGLFDPTPASGNSPLSLPFLDESPSARTPDSSLHSPVHSVVSITPTSENRPTLSNELGDQWSMHDTGNHHLRDTSLYQFTLPSPSPLQNATLPPEQPNIHASTFHGRPNSQPTLNPSPSDSHNGHIARYQRMSQTVRARADQLIGGRFKDTLLGSKAASQTPQKEGETGRKGFTHIPQSLVGVFHSMADTETIRPGNRKDDSLSPCTEEDSCKAGPKTEIDASVTAVVVNTSGDKKVQGVSKFVLELWLWLQFLVIIVVFLWAVAKRGPRHVLGDAERKRVTRS